MSDQSPEVVLLAVISVAHAERVQCQCHGCGHSVWKQVHMVKAASGAIECWGSTCFAREAGEHYMLRKALYPGVGGLKLTDEEREMLLHNREALIARFKAEQEEAIRREEETRKEQDARNARIRAEQEEAFQKAEEARKEAEARAARIRAEREEAFRREEEARKEAEARQLEAWRRQAEVERKPDDATLTRESGSPERRKAAIDHTPSPYDFAEKTCVLCGRRTREWWTNEGKDGCQCKECYGMGRMLRKR